MFKQGDSVLVTPKGRQWQSFYAYIDGWRGTFQGFNNGNAEIKCTTPDGDKTFFLPPDCLTLTV